MVGKRIFRQAKFFVLSEFNPIFMLIPILENHKELFQKFVTLEQIIEAAMLNYQGGLLSEEEQSSTVSPEFIYKDEQGHVLEVDPNYSGRETKETMMNVFKHSKKVLRNLKLVCEVLLDDEKQ